MTAEPRARRLTAFLLLVVAVAALVWETVLAERRIYPRFVDSDTVWLLSLAHDVFERGGELWGWNLSPHPNFFPEFLMVDLVRRLTSTLPEFFLGYGLLNVGAFFFACWLGLLFHLRARGNGEQSREQARATSGEIALLGAFLVTGAWLLDYDLGLFPMPFRYPLVPAFHFLSLVMALLIAFIAIDQFDRPLSWRTTSGAMGAALLMLASGLSDKLTVLYVLPALGAAALHQVICAGASASIALATLPVVAAGIVCLQWADAFWNSFSGVTSYPVWIRVDHLGAQAARLWGAVFDSGRGAARYTWEAWAQTGLIVLFAIVALVLSARILLMVVRALRTRGAPVASASEVKAVSLEVYLLSAPFLITVAVLLLGRFPDAYHLRMVTPLFFFIPLVIVMHVLGRMASRIRPRALVACFMAAAIVAIALPAWKGPARVVTSPVPPLLACLETQGRRYDLRNGLGFHWQSHLTTVLSGHRILVRSIERDGLVPRWHNNFAWYERGSTKEPFTFIVVTPDFDTRAIERRFGPPTHRVECPVSEEYAAWSASALTPAELWIYEGPAELQLNRAIQYQYRMGVRRIHARPQATRAPE